MSLHRRRACRHRHGVVQAAVDSAQVAEQYAFAGHQRSLADVAAEGHPVLKDPGRHATHLDAVVLHPRMVSNEFAEGVLQAALAVNAAVLQLHGLAAGIAFGIVGAQGAYDRVFQGGFHGGEDVQRIVGRLRVQLGDVVHHEQAQRLVEVKVRLQRRIDRRGPPSVTATSSTTPAASKPSRRPSARLSSFSLSWSVPCERWMSSFSRSRPPFPCAMHVTRSFWLILNCDCSGSGLLSTRRRKVFLSSYLAGMNLVWLLALRPALVALDDGRRRHAHHQSRLVAAGPPGALVNLRGSIMSMEVPSKCSSDGKITPCPG